MYVSAEATFGQVITAALEFGKPTDAESRAHQYLRTVNFELHRAILLGRCLEEF